MLKHIKRNYQYYLSFFIPALLILLYFACRGTYPFGKSSLLTVDLGQQYIDFFAYYKASLLHHPTTLLYSFSKALGGDMVGVSAYYLISPFNLIFLITPQKYFPVAIWLMTILKFGCAGLTSAIFFKKSKLLDGLLVPTFGVSYGLMSYLVVNHFNLMWLDGVIMLPLVALSLSDLWYRKYPFWFAITLGVTILLNYYIGFMVVLFSILYFLFLAVIRNLNFKQWWQSFLKFTTGGLLGAGLAAVLLLPTLSALTESKGQYTITKIHWHFEYAPWQGLLKLFIGTFNFDQMSTGYANIFTGSLALFGFILFFTVRRIPLRVKITAGLISLFLALSLCYEPLDLLWHGLQFPVWYPYRFSFVISFWLLILAAYTLRYTRQISTLQTLLCLGVTSGLSILALSVNKDFNFLDRSQIIITALFMLSILVLLNLRTTHFHGINNLFLIVVTIEMGTNLWLSLDPISYLTENEFANYTTQLVKGSNAVKQKATQPFYRIGKTYERTKNDPMEADYYGASQFNSMMEPKVTKFFGKIGQPKGDGFVTYNNGTLLTDALLGMQYFMHERQDTLLPAIGSTNNSVLPVVSSRPDLAEYTTTDVLSLQTIHKNPYALPIAYMVNHQVTTTKAYTSFPLAQQEAILHSTAPNLTQPLFTAESYQIKLQNMKLKKKAIGLDYTKINTSNPGKVTLTFTPTTDDPYYMTWGASLNNKVVGLNINGQTIKLDDSYDNTLVYGIADHQKDEPIKITLTSKGDNLWLDNLSISQMNRKLFKRWNQQLQAQSLKYTKVTPLTISGTITAKEDQVLMTSIPNGKGWHIKVDNKHVKKRQLLKTFVGAQLKPGKHKITIYYRPPYLITGLIITSLAIIGIGSSIILEKKRAGKGTV
ncbi:YfhO family protein [Agrilactobacillus yilanensis]|uniref:YfhO family protein n=1 Tax=Agrilactobacillus yilanensis TaxID=2485997 RepID=A0ABW4JAN5_9LACO|nr:YfhO family protein [Agrilactobacillus yilanensis]